MYSVFILCATLSAVAANTEYIKLSPEFLSKVEPYIKKCEAETKPPANAFHNMLKGVIENEAGLQFSFCYLLEAGFIKQDGRANITTLRALLKDEERKEKFKEIMEECNKVNDQEPIEVFRAMFKCYGENSQIKFTA